MVAFFLPWYSACGTDVTGAQIGSNSRQYSDGDSSWIVLWGVPACGALICLLALKTSGGRAKLTFLLSVIGAGLVLLSFAAIKDHSVVKVKYGFWLEFAGFGAAVVGALGTVGQGAESSYSAGRPLPSRTRHDPTPSAGRPLPSRTRHDPTPSAGRPLLSRTRHDQNPTREVDILARASPGFCSRCGTVRAAGGGTFCHQCGTAAF
jgi:hypothetical protein